MQTGARYGAVAIWLHWLIAITLAFQLGLGFAMPAGAKGFTLLQLHKSVGITVLLLTVCRIAWRLLRKPPAALESGWQAALAKGVHIGLYAFMVAAPLTGWALVSTAPVKVPTVLFGKVGLPHLPLSHSLFQPAELGHVALAWIGAALIALHVAGALRHQLLLRDLTLARMAPAGSPAVALSLLALALLFFVVPFALPIQQTGRVAAPTVIALPPKATEATHSPAPLVPVREEPLDKEEEAVAPPQWTIAPGGSLGFTLGNGDERIAGRFDRWSGSIAFDPDDPTTADIRIDVNLASASVGDATQDSMLRQADFLGPSGKATWRSTSVRQTGAGSYTAQGRLSLKGQTKLVPLNFTLKGGAKKKTVSGQTTLDRTAFGIGSGEVAAALSPTVNVEFSFDAARN